MSTVFDSGHAPDPADAVDVLAFVLCPPAAFAAGSATEDLDAVSEVIGPAKREAVLRWQELARARTAS